jgi:hypothetical protein
MSSGVAVATDESKAQFIEELVVYVQDRKENPPSGVLLPRMIPFNFFIYFFFFQTANVTCSGLTEFVATN